jgi:hypothetical protein
MFYTDPVSGNRRVKRRFVWALYGFTLGVFVGKLLVT